MAAKIARVYYVLARSESNARDLATAIARGIIPAMAQNRAELLALRDLHPLPMLGSVLPFAVFTGLANGATSRLDSGDWATEVCNAIRRREANVVCRSA